MTDDNVKPDKKNEPAPKSEGTGKGAKDGKEPCEPFPVASELPKALQATPAKGEAPAGNKAEPEKAQAPSPTQAPSPPASQPAPQPMPTTTGTVKPYTPDIPACEPPLRAFMVALRPNQPPLKLQADNPADLKPHLEGTNLAWVNCRVKDLEKDAVIVAKSLGFNGNLVESLLMNRNAGYEDHEFEMGLMLPAIRVEQLKVNASHFLILIKEGLIFTIHGETVVRLVKFARYAETILRKIPVNIHMKDKLTVMLERILDENNERNFDGIRTIEEDSDEVGKMLSDPKTPMVKLSPIIYEMKHALISYLNLLWETQNVIHSLRYGDPEILSDDPDLLEKLEILGEDVTRHIQLGENLSEVLASGLEVLQGIYNNQLQIINNRMALVLTWATILGTAFLVPNTIATALGNTAYDLKPSDAWWYSIMLILSMVVSTLFSWWFLKKKGLLPETVD
jgi:magnesium transporter